MRFHMKYKNGARSLIKLKKEERGVEPEGSYTLESSMVVPLVIVCVFFLIIMNFILHDQVVINSAAANALYQMDDQGLMAGKIGEEVDQNTIYLGDPDISCKVGIMNTKIAWKKVFDLPGQKWLSHILEESQVSLGGNWEHYSWNMSQVLRIKEILDS